MNESSVINIVSPVGRSVDDFCRVTGAGRTSLYTLPSDLQPESVKVGKRRIIIEDPLAWLRRVNGAKVLA